MAKKIKAKQTEGLVDIATDQYISGVKTFEERVQLRETAGAPAGGADWLAITLRKHSPAWGSGQGLYIGHDGKTFMFDMQDLADYNFTQSTFRVVPLNGNLLAKTQLGFKRTFDLDIIKEITIVNSGSSQHNVNILSYIVGWDNGDALIQGMNWDIVWTSGLPSNLRFHSLKQMHAANAVWDLTIRFTSTGVFLVGKLNDGVSLSIPPGAKLMIW